MCPSTVLQGGRMTERERERQREIDCGAERERAIEMIICPLV